ncbi:MAG: DNA translocase FtsK 4TM domain-containing protein [Alphaproteobacteria bacterium]|nr:DNA translocase FtsK 4TM domain-containing protein [Alphaproteobacteria bacterium]
MNARTAGPTMKAGGRRPLLPDWMSALIRQRAIEGLGIGLILLALAIFAALFSFDPNDPSLNTAINRTPSNLLGGAGAAFADAALQSVGASAFLAAPILAAWGWRILVDHTLRHRAVRLISAIVVLVLASGALAGLTPAPGWPFDVGLGGLLGETLLGALQSGLAALSIAAPGDWVLVAGFGLAAALLGIPVLGFTWGEWVTAFLTVRASAGAARRAADPDTLRGAVAKAKRAVADSPIAEHLPGAWGGRAEPVLIPRVKPEGPPRETPDPTRPSRPGRVAERADKNDPKARPKKARQIALDLSSVDGAFHLPTLSLLDQRPTTGAAHQNQDALEQNARLLEGVLEDFGVNGEIVKVRPGPVVTLYELEPAPGTKSSRVIGLADDIARSMSAISVRIATVPGRNVIGIELPNASREVVGFRDLVAAPAFADAKAKLPMILGKDISGAPEIADLATMPHLLIAGTTGSGKSVGLNAMILSLLYRLPPERCKFIMIDPKMLELSVYDDIPHLLSPVVTDPKKAVVALKWAVREMEDRYRAMSKLGVRNIEGYNKRVSEAARRGEEITRRVQTGFDSETGRPIFEEEPLDLTPFPYIVVVVDEMADLMLVAGKEIEASIQRLAQMARAAGIHIIMATQRPSVDVITGTIKANFPVRISFMVTSKIDSRTILGEQGAEQLLGKGDMLFMAGGGRIKRLHGPFVDDSEVEAVCDFLREQAAPDYVEAVTDETDMSGGFDTDVSGATGFGDGLPGEGGSAEDALYDQAVALVAREGKASTSFVQRHLQIGYNRAARIIERMEKEGVVSTANHVGKREVLVGDHSR